MLESGIVCTFGSMSAPDKVFALLLRLWNSNDRFINQQHQFAMEKFESQSSLLKVCFLRKNVCVRNLHGLTAFFVLFQNQFVWVENCQHVPFVQKKEEKQARREAARTEEATRSKEAPSIN